MATGNPQNSSCSKPTFPQCATSSDKSVSAETATYALQLNASTASRRAQRQFLLRQVAKSQLSYWLSFSETESSPSPGFWFQHCCTSLASATLAWHTACYDFAALQILLAAWGSRALPAASKAFSREEQHTAYSIQHTAYSIPRTSYSIRHTAYGIRHTAYGIRHTAYGIYMAYSIQHAAYGIQRTACSISERLLWLQFLQLQCSLCNTKSALRLDLH